jgi:hypothetical protein
MKKVGNNKNHAALKKLANHFIRPLLVSIVEAKKLGCCISSNAVISSIPIQSRKTINNALNIALPKLSTLKNVCNAAIVNTDQNELESALKLYDAQAAAIESGTYSIKQVKTPKAIKDLFVKTLYGELFDNDIIWSSLKLASLTREQFHKNFQEDNAYPSTCPYCDLDTINSAGTRIIEHFLPKAKFPLLALHPLNLFTACQGCNSPSAKGQAVTQKVTSPYLVEVGSHVDFLFDPFNRKITIAAQHGNSEIDGFLRLVKLPKRYEDTNTWMQFDGRRQAFIESVQEAHRVDLITLLAYVKRFQVGAVLTYALSDWTRSIYWPTARK